MSLAARCPSCGTVFRVVQDQLKVSEGWVRCGRCDGVFNAAEALFDIDSGTPVQLVLTEPTAAASGAGSGAGSSAGNAASPEAAAAAVARIEPSELAPTPVQRPSGAPLPDAQMPASGGPPPEAIAPTAPAPSPASASADAPAPAWSASSTPAWARAEGRQEPHFDPPAPAAAQPSTGFGSEPAAAVSLADFGPRDEPLLRAPSPVSDEEASAAPEPPYLPPPLPAPATGSTAPDTPSFMRTAERAALWRRPMVRSALAAAVLLLAMALAAQLALVWRDSLAAHLPASEPALRSLCRLAGCQLQPLRRIEALSVDSSGLNRLEGSSLYRLQVVLHNRADIAVMMPALDLTLTDAQGRLVSRRVLQVAELGEPQTLLQPGQELPIKVLLSTGDKRIDGYTLEVFYP